MTVASALPTVTLDQIRAAAATLKGAVVATPLSHSRTLSAITGAQVFVKFENLQFTGSFKDRGSLVKLSQLTEAQRRTGIIAVSAGNHAQGVAYHAQRLGIPATIVMPEITPYTKIRQTKEFGARVLLHGQNLADTEPFAAELVAREKLTLIHPYDDPAIVAGQGTVALEMLAAEPLLDVLIVPVGGGGLIAGCAVAAKGLKPDIQVFGAETALYPSLYQRMRGLPPKMGGATIADGIAVKTIGKVPFAIHQKLVDDVMVVNEPEIEQAICLYLDIEKTVAEGAGATPLAALVTHPQRFAGKRVGLVLSGGNIDARLLAQVINRGMVRSGRVLSLRVDINDVPGTLAKVATVIGETGGNIIEVRHQRLFTDIPAKAAELDLMVETRDPESARDMIARLQAAGFTVHVLSSASSGSD
ncbi:MAG: threonine ammonia-lyase [Alphaproteobacteria bacterium]|nr:threonine ammonia-lyase [Alphaproteobacteria bacterium]